MNPNASPNSPLDAQTPSASVIAVLIGAAIGNGISYAVLFVFGLVFLWVLALQGVPTPELYMKAYQSTPYLVFAHAVNFLCLIPGGYWSARLGPHKPLVMAIIAGSLVAAFEATTNLIPYELPIPLWSRFTSVAIAIPAFGLGAVWWKRAA